MLLAVTSGFAAAAAAYDVFDTGCVAGVAVDDGCTVAAGGICLIGVVVVADGVAVGAVVGVAVVGVAVVGVAVVGVAVFGVAVVGVAVGVAAVGVAVVGVAVVGVAVTVDDDVDDAALADSEGFLLFLFFFTFGLVSILYQIK